VLSTAYQGRRDGCLYKNPLQDSPAPRKDVPDLKKRVLSENCTLPKKTRSQDQHTAFSKSLSLEKPRRAKRMLYVHELVEDATTMPRFTKKTKGLFFLRIFRHIVAGYNGKLGGPTLRIAAGSIPVSKAIHEKSVLYHVRRAHT